MPENPNATAPAQEGAIPPSPGAVAKKLRGKKAAEAPLATSGARKSIALEAGVKAKKPTDPTALYQGHPFERLMMSMVWPMKLSTAHSQRHRHWGEEAALPDFEDDTAAWVGSGREESLALGATPEVIELLQKDEELCEAVCKITLLGCKDLRFFGKEARQGSGNYGQLSPKESATVALLASGVFEALKTEVKSPSGLRETLLALAGDEKEWEGASLRGQMEASAEELKSPQRGGRARAALARMGMWQKSSRNSPAELYRSAMSARAWAPTGGVGGGLCEEGEIETYLRELEGYERALPVFFAEALKLAERDPKLLPAFEKMCSERCSFGFESTRPEDSAKEILPELGELTRLKRSGGTSERKKAEKELERGLVGEGAAGQLAFAAAKAYGLEAETPQALVGEAKRALQERAGLSAASWKMALSSPAALAALVAGLEQSEKIARNAEALVERRETLRNNRAEEAKRKREQGERLVEARFDAAGRKAAESLGATVSARALSLGLAQGIAPESIERAIRLGWKMANDRQGRGSARFVINALAGRAPYTGFHTAGSPDAVRQLLADTKAAQEQGAAWVKIICEQLDKRVKKGLAIAGFASEQEAAAALESEVPEEENERRAQRVFLESLARPKKKKITALEKIENNAAISLGNDLDLLCDYIRSMEGGFFANLPKKLAWGTLMRQQEIWHEDQTRRRYENDPSSSRVWEPALGAIESGEFKAVELVNGRQLIEEGEQMRHCVASYTSRCLEGSSRIFSIRRHGARVATLELAPLASSGASTQWKEGGKGVARWDIEQNKGRHNAAVTDALTLAFCDQVRARANEALAKLKEEAKNAPAQPRAPGA